MVAESKVSQTARAPALTPTHRWDSSLVSATEPDKSRQIYCSQLETTRSILFHVKEYLRRAIILLFRERTKVDF